MSSKLFVFTFSRLELCLSPSAPQHNLFQRVIVPVALSEGRTQGDDGSQYIRCGTTL
eukprot:m.478733 g.478733  ORF g.478733 m.478733 type:complete len:57 (-) comp47436_c0_seq1:79-249(-)